MKISNSRKNQFLKFDYETGCRKEVNKDREYREQRDETPSHTGGVSKEARKREEERRRREDRGITYDSRAKDKKDRSEPGSKDRDRAADKDLRREKYERDRRNERDWSREGERERDRASDRDRRRDRSRRDSDWERETPRSDRSDREEVRTPLIRLRDTPGHAGWDEDDDDTPGKISSWDLPTPNSLRREDDSSIRSSDLKFDRTYASRRDKFDR